MLSNQELYDLRFKYNLAVLEHDYKNARIISDYILENGYSLQEREYFPETEFDRTMQYLIE